MGAPAPTGTSPWWAGPLFHFLTGLTAIAAGILWLRLGGDGMEAAAAFGGGLVFLGVGVGVSASGSGGA
jgi:hypothetical protein